MAHGDATVTLRPTYGSGVVDTTSGYVRRWCPGHPTASADGYALEHRMIAWDHGILSDLTNHVHHRNGVKDDNRPENLEQMTPSEHHRHHIADAGQVTNQYGTWPVGSTARPG